MEEFTMLSKIRPNYVVQWLIMLMAVLVIAFN